MTTPLRLIAEPENDLFTVRFFAEFPAPEAGAAPKCGPATLFAGDPADAEPHPILAEMLLCAPGEVTWREQSRIELGGYTFASPAPHTAYLRWGDATIPAAPPAVVPSPLPTLLALAVKPSEDGLSQAVIHITVSGLTAGQRVRVDAGAGHIYSLSTGEGSEAQGEWVADYAKTGDYTVAADLLDSEGYRLAALGHAAVTLGAVPTLPVAPETPAAPLADSLDLAASAAVPWLPHSYVRPAWGGVRTYSVPGGGAVVRSLALGTYLAIQRETAVNGQIWQQSVQGDWVPFGSVIAVTPSELRGVELAAAPPPPPPPGGARSGVVTASTLNVRARPGVSADNPPIAQLSYGATVTIYEEQNVAGAPWYRIGDNRWVHSSWVRIVDNPPAGMRTGVVTADVLNVRARPGVSADNPPIAQLMRGATVSIYEEQSVAGVFWYRVGADRWAHSGWIQISATNALSAAPASAPANTVTLPVGWVAVSALNIRARPGVSPDNPPIGAAAHNERVDILETQSVDGAAWYRIGADRWVLAQSVAAARLKARPAGIGSDDYWVAVNLAEQTAVAYYGDTPVYAAMVATGMATTPTVQGVFRTWQRTASGRMAGGSAATGGYYYLEGVTWTCYFYSGYALHTAYWHDAFGRPRSHGCVNFSPYDAWWIYQWSAAGGTYSPAVYVYAR